MNARRTALPRRGQTWLVVLLGSMWAGCSSAPKAPPAPLATPVVSASVTHHAGAPLARATTRPIDPSAAADALAVQVTWTALERVPDGLTSVTSTARLIAVPTSTQPIATSGRLISAVRLVGPAAIDQFLADMRGGKFGRTVEIASSRGALPADVTAAFALSDGPVAPDRRRVELAVYRSPTVSGGDEMQLGLLISDPPRRERALLDPTPLGASTKLAVVLPSHFGRSESRATLAVIDISRESVPGQAEALAQCIKELSSPPMAATQPAMPPAEWSGLAATLQTLSAQPDAARAAVIFLAGQTGASLCGDVALVADDTTIASLAQRITSKVGPDPSPIDKARLGWALDSACFEELATLQSRDKMPPELTAVLTAYAGEAGRHAASLEEVAKGLTNREQLEARLLAENLVYLEDASPAARVRAFDWLATKDHAPAGYDPLGSNKERRAALDKAISAAATIPPGGTK